MKTKIGIIAIKYKKLLNIFFFSNLNNEKVLNQNKTGGLI